MRMTEDKTKPTQKQLDYARSLMAELGYDCDNIYEMCNKDLYDMTRKEVSQLIDDLKDELEG